ncbi:MAG: hypothetical protein V4721_10335 [Bacteroidota bacterium]
MKNQDNSLQQIVQHGLDNMESIQPGQEASDLHHELYNRDYFIIGYYQAEQFLVNGPGVFAAISEIQEYENDNFGEVNTDCGSSEKVANMYAYIKGEEVLHKCPTLQKQWDKKLTAADIKKIIKELKAQL